jgi:hypothetical protein
MRRINAKHLYRPAAELATTYKAQAKGDQDDGDRNDHSRAACPAQGPPLLPDAILRTIANLVASWGEDFYEEAAVLGWAADWAKRTQSAF